ncbi:MAG: hypothetical protein AAGA60_11005 [Cyanobacteria bacterium P01_E01_bin.42]
MAYIKDKCQDCDRNIPMFVKQHADRSGLVWSLEYCCPYCGCTISLDDRGYPPEDIREAILAAEGEWYLAIAETDPGLILITVSRLRNVLNLSLSEAMQLKRKIPGEIASGTRAEMERLRIILDGDAIDTKVERKYC